MFRENRTKYIILGMLTKKPASGYELNKLIKLSTSYFWSESQGQIYPTLKECVINNFIVCKEILNTNKKLKKVYSITLDGRNHLCEWLEQNPQKDLIRSEFLLKIFL